MVNIKTLSTAALVIGAASIAVANAESLYDIKTPDFVASITIPDGSGVIAYAGSQTAIITKGGVVIKGYDPHSSTPIEVADVTVSDGQHGFLHYKVAKSDVTNETNKLPYSDRVYDVSGDHVEYSSKGQGHPAGQTVTAIDDSRPLVKQSLETIDIARQTGMAVPAPPVPDGQFPIAASNLKAFSIQIFQKLETSGIINYNLEPSPPGIPVQQANKHTHG